MFSLVVLRKYPNASIQIFVFFFCREMKRILLLIDNFVPIEIKSRIYKQARYDEELEEWMNNSSHLNNPNGVRRPVSQPSRRRPISEYAIKAMPENEASAIHLRSENIISHKNPKVSASLQAVIAEVLENGRDIDISDQVRITLDLPFAIQPLTTRRFTHRI